MTYVDAYKIFVNIFIFNETVKLHIWVRVVYDEIFGLEMLRLMFIQRCDVEYLY